MESRRRSVRQDQTCLSQAMRGNGHSWRQVADEFVGQWGLTYLQAFRLAHGWSQQEAAKHYNERWHPQRPLTGKHISYWEMWPSKSGKEPPLSKLRMLADVYECSSSSLKLRATAGVLGYVAVGRGEFPLARAYCLEAFHLADFAHARLRAWARGLQSKTYLAGTIFVRHHGKTEQADPGDIGALEARLLAPRRDAEARQVLMDMSPLVNAVLFKAGPHANSAVPFRLPEQNQIAHMIAGHEADYPTARALAGASQGFEVIRAAGDTNAEIEAMQRNIEARPKRPRSGRDGRVVTLPVVPRRDNRTVIRRIGSSVGDAICRSCRDQRTCES